MRISKKILACVLAALMAVAMMPISALADTIPYTATTPVLEKEFSVDNEWGTIDAWLADPDINNGRLQLSEDIEVTEPIVIPEGLHIQLDLNGHSIIGNVADKMIKNYGTVEFVSYYGNGGHIYNTNTAGQGRDAFTNYGTLVVDDDVWFGDADEDMTNDNATTRGAGLRNFGTATINTGHFTNINNAKGVYAYAIINDGNGTLTINDATVYGHNHGNVCNNDGTINIYGGNFSLVKTYNNSDYNLYVCETSVTNVYGGTFSCTGNYAAVCVDEADYVSAGINISGGSFTYTNTTVGFKKSNSTNDKVQISGGTFSGDVSAYCAEDYKTVYDENTGRYVIEEIAYGTIALYPAGDADITGSGTAHEKITISNTALNYAAADYSVGRYYDGYYMSGIKFVAPEGTNISQNARYTNGSVDSTTGQLKVKNLYTAKDGANFMYSWPHVTEESLKEAIAAGQNKTWEYTFDWDGDGVFEQEAIIELVCDTIALVKDNVQVYPSDVEDGFSITAEDNVDLNFYLGASDEIDHIVVTHSDPENNDGSTVTTTKAAVSLQNYGDKKVYKVELAPAQLKDTIRIAVYEDSSTIDRVIVTSVDEYCRTLIAMDNEYLGEKAAELKDLARATLDYGKAASSYFEYNEDAFDGVSNELDEPDLTDGRLAVASGSNTYNIPFTGVSYVATTVPALRFTVRSDFSENYLTELNETIETNIGEAKFVKVEEGGQVKRMLQITGINICDFGKQIVVNAGGSTILTFVPITWAKSAAKITTNDRLASLGKTICNYYINSTEYFGIKA